MTEIQNSMVGKINESSELSFYEKASNKEEDEIIKVYNQHSLHSKEFYKSLPFDENLRTSGIVENLRNSFIPEK